MRSPRTRRAVTWLLALALLALTGCASGEKLSRKEKGDRAFARGDWPQAIDEYRLYLDAGGGGAETMVAQFQLARSYFENEDFPTAAVEFEIYQRNYPRSDSLEAAAYYEAQCWVRQSLPYDRDQSPTEQAIRKLEAFLLDYPASPYREPARQSILELSEKLARKALATARLYRRLRRPEAARIYYEKLLREHPTSAYLPEALFELLEIQTDAEDWEAARRTYERLQGEYPGSDSARRAQELLPELR